MSIQFSEQSLSKVDEIIARYPEGKQKSALLPVLHVAQEEFGGLVRYTCNGLCS
jgi:NADH-quinone oxidoreductase subunit E